VTDIGAIVGAKRPVDAFGDPVVDSLVWSDPNDMVDGFRPSPTRGAGFLFGEAALDSFLKKSQLEMLVRAHECVPNGAAWMWRNRVITVFSASNYCGLMGNFAAVLEVKGPGVHSVRSFPPLPWLPRSGVKFGKDPLSPSKLGVRASGTATVLATGVRAPSDSPLAKIHPGATSKTLSARSRPSLVSAPD
jgi:hypothetical protein